MISFFIILSEFVDVEGANRSEQRAENMEREGLERYACFASAFPTSYGILSGRLGTQVIYHNDDCLFSWAIGKSFILQGLVFQSGEF